MLDVKKTFIVDENNKKIAVQLDIDTFERIEETLENYGLIKLIQESDDGSALTVSEAQTYYKSLKKR